MSAAEAGRPVGSVDDFPGGRWTMVEVDGREVGIFNGGERLYTVRDECPHQRAPLCVGAPAGTMLPSAPIVDCDVHPPVDGLAELLPYMEQSWRRRFDGRDVVAAPGSSPRRRPPSEYVFDHVRFTTEPFDEPADVRHLHAVLEMVEARRTLLFSTDYPHWDNDTPALVLGRLPVEIRDRVASENARELFGERLVGAWDEVAA
jgi:hypothetical protein